MTLLLSLCFLLFLKGFCVVVVVFLFLMCSCFATGWRIFYC